MNTDLAGTVAVVTVTLIWADTATMLLPASTVMANIVRAFEFIKRRGEGVEQGPLQGGEGGGLVASTSGPSEPKSAPFDDVFACHGRSGSAAQQAPPAHRRSWATQQWVRNKASSLIAKVVRWSTFDLTYSDHHIPTVSLTKGSKHGRRQTANTPIAYEVKTLLFCQSRERVQCVESPFISQHQNVRKGNKQKKTAQCR